MARPVMDDGTAQKVKPQLRAPRVPAWLGRNNHPLMDIGESNNHPVQPAPIVNNPASGAWANYNQPQTPAWLKTAASAIAAANTSGGGQWFSMDGQTAPQPAFVNPSPPQTPAWLKTAASAIAAANTNGGGQWFSMDGQTAPQPAFVNPNQAFVNRNAPRPLPNPATMVNNYNQAPVDDSMSDTLRSMNLDPGAMTPEYVGQPVNDSMSDTLRSIQPVLRGNSPTFSDYLRDLMMGTPPAWAAPSGSGGGSGSGYGSGGFGSRYGGNWGGGGGGGWGGGGGYGNDYPAWAQDMGLYSWKFGQ